MSNNVIERLFKLQEHGTTVRTEIIAGLTTFAAMSYILVVNPGISLSNTPNSCLCVCFCHDIADNQLKAEGAAVLVPTLQMLVNLTTLNLGGKFLLSPSCLSVPSSTDSCDT